MSLKNLPRKWSRRMFAIYLAVTFIGGSVLAVLLILFGLLYWMKASYPLPGEGRVIHPDADAVIVFRLATLDELPAEASGVLASGAPSQVLRLVQKGRQARTRIVLSLKDRGVNQAIAISLARFPGMFRLVKRDLERRTQKGSYAADLEMYRGKTIFVERFPRTPFATLCIAECTVFRATDRAMLTRLLDQFVLNEREAALGWERPPDSAPALFQGWYNAWPSRASLHGIASETWASRWNHFSAELLKRFPVFDTACEFWGGFSGGALSLEFAFSGQNVDVRPIASDIEEWAVQSGKEIGIMECHAATQPDPRRLSLKLRFEDR